MNIDKYFYSVGSNKLSDRIELIENRKSYMTMDYIEMFKDKLREIKTKGRTAFLYAGGVSIHQAEGRNYSRGTDGYTVPVNQSGMVVREISAYMMHKYIGLLKDNNNITYASINSNTCASSMYSLYEAERLLDSNEVDNVIIIAEEKTSLNTIRIFKEHKIDLICGEGFACMVLDNSFVNKIGRISKTKWKYKYDNNPFLVSSEGYESVKTFGYDSVKGHKTGTKVNDEAETSAFGSEVIGYKDKIGHTQGASALIEICMVLEDDKIKTNSKVLCTASGLGGFYGSCMLLKVK